MLPPSFLHDVGPHRMRPMQDEAPLVARPCIVSSDQYRSHRSCAMKNLFFRLIAIYKRLDESIRREERLAKPRKKRLSRMKKLKVRVRQRLDAKLLSPV